MDCPWSAPIFREYGGGRRPDLFLAPPGDQAGLAEKIVQLMGDPHLRKRYGEELGIRAAEEFSLQRMLDCSVECFADVMTGLERGGTHTR